MANPTNPTNDDINLNNPKKTLNPGVARPGKDRDVRKSLSDVEALDADLDADSELEDDELDLDAEDDMEDDEMDLEADEDGEADDLIASDDTGRPAAKTPADKTGDMKTKGKGSCGC